MDTRIPKKIHYCWFGPKEMPEDVYRCLNSWKKFLPDYEIKLWNEENFDIEQSLFVKQAYEAKKFAFVSDYVRLYVLYTEGGIYMDTDVEVIKNLDIFLNHSAFSGSESIDAVPTGIMGAEKHHPWIKRLLDYYNNRSFFKNDGSMDLKTNTKIITEIMQSEFYWMPGKNDLQILKHDVFIYPSEYFCPKNWQTKEINLTPNSYVIHHFNGSWQEKATNFELLIYSLKVIVYKILRKEKYEKLKRRLKI